MARIGVAGVAPTGSPSGPGGEATVSCSWRAASTRAPNEVVSLSTCAPGGLGSAGGDAGGAAFPALTAARMLFTACTWRVASTRALKALVCCIVRAERGSADFLPPSDRCLATTAAAHDSLPPGEITRPRIERLATPDRSKRPLLGSLAAAAPGARA